MKRILIILAVLFSFTAQSQKVGNFRQQYSGDTYFQNYSEYLVRASLDSGVIESMPNTFKILKGLKAIGILDSVKFLWTGEMGTKERVSGVNHYATKLYSGDTASNDATQTTELNQPNISGNIAPNEKLCLNNPNGYSKSILQPNITFEAGVAWTSTYVFNTNGSNSTYQFFHSIGSTNGFYYVNNSILGYKDFNNIYNEFGNINIIGKITMITYVCNGTTIQCYINGILLGTITPSSTKVIFSELIKGYVGLPLYGKLYNNIIHAQALTPTQVTAEYNLLRSIYPEMESVVIGSQEWATSNCDIVTTCMGNVIPNMVENSSVEQITDTSLNVASEWSLSSGVTISGGKMNFNVATGLNIWRFGLANYSKYYKVTIDVSDYTSGIVNASIGNEEDSTSLVINGTGIFTAYIRSGLYSKNYFVLNTAKAVLSITSISVKNYGWADATDLYNGLIAQGSTVAQATKEAAMWCYYNNDPTLGSIYGKLYNWYAVKLIQDDIDAYNAANPDNHWGYHVPTSTEFNTLATTLGGASVAGGKMKVAGTDYWGSPNTGADNSSGFSALGVGTRFDDGSFGDLLGYYRLYTIAGSSSWLNVTNEEILNGINLSPKFGMSLRFIKD